MAHPTILRLNRSTIPARYKKPSWVWMQVMSAAHFRFMPVAVKSRSSRFSKTG